MKIKFKKLDNFISAPIRAHENDSGADVFATEDLYLGPHDRYAMPLGFCLEIPENYMGIIITKSSTFKKGLYAHIPPIDSGYIGECHALLENVTDNYIKIERGTKVGQLVIIPIITPEFEEVKELKKTLRGDGAFGSTGNNLNENKTL